MRILFITPTFPPQHCDIGNHTFRLAQAIGQYGHESAVITRAGDINGAGSRGEVYNVIGRWDFSCLKPIYRTINDWRPDIVHLQYEEAAFRGEAAICFLPLLLWKKGIPCCVTLHEACPPFFWHGAVRVRLGGKIKFPWLDLIPPGILSRAGFSPAALSRHRTSALKSLLGCASRIIVSNQEGKDFVTPFVTRKRNIVSIPMGTGIAVAERSEPEKINHLRLPSGKFLMIYLGYLLPSKGIGELIEAMGLLKTEPVHLIIMGGKNEFMPEADYRKMLEVWKGRADELGISECITWTGFIDERTASQLLPRARIAVLPFRDGAVFKRSSLMTAIAHGLPIVTTEGKFTTADVRTLRSVVFVRPGDSQGLAEKCRQIIRSDQEYSQLRIQAKVLQEKFSWQAIAVRTAGIYHELAGISLS
ncbi:MAG: glycosyltransferase [bacterium]